MCVCVCVCVCLCVCVCVRVFARVQKSSVPTPEETEKSRAILQGLKSPDAAKVAAGKERIAHQKAGASGGHPAAANKDGGL